ncbi:MAG TPA: glycosyltransferase family 2 protein [Terriglobia bacterium]|nr:glycosyltransferase family 2 protein [Terriglobia bacterium]
MKYLLGIPFTNRKDLLERAIASVKPLWPHALIVDNSEPGLDPAAWPVQVVPPPVPLTFSQTMNLLQRLASEGLCDALLYMHNDAEAGPGTAERLLAIAGEALVSGRRWGVAFTHYDTLASFNMTAVREVGRWDTNLPQYFADNDYYRRVRLAGYEIIETGLPVTHAAGGSNTINSDSHRLFLNGVTFPLHERYYAAKWGGLPGRETYARPFNGVV